MISIAINGFGRIGRRVFRLALENPSIEIVAINDIADAYTLSHLLKYDSIHGVLKNDVSYLKNAIVVNDIAIPLLNEKDISKIDWRPFKPEFVIDLKLRGYKKKLAKSSDVENLYWWASFINVTILQPDLNKIYFNENLKNLLKKKIPAQITEIDDWYKFYMSTVQLFDNYSINVSSPDQKWASKSSKNEQLFENMEKLKPLFDKLK